MITLEGALEIMKEHVFVQKTERIPLSLSLNRILSCDIISDTDFPPFNKSAVDGFACLRSDLPGILTVTDKIRAGFISGRKVQKGECIKVMTGAPVPEGADCIVMIEDVENIDDTTIKINNAAGKTNICIQGEDLKKGDTVIKRGSLITKKHVGSLASAGMHQIEVFKQPVVTVFSTGTELVEPEDKLAPAKIRNSNGSQLIAQLASMGITALYGGITDDDIEIMQVELSRSIENFDGLILSGGVSAGDYDFVPEVLTSMGFNIHFHKLNVKPGKPVLFATKGNKFCFGMPGNPVSSFVQFELLVKPYLYSLMGHKYKPTDLYLIAGSNFKRKNADAEGFIPVSLNEKSEITELDYHGSGHVVALNHTFGLLRMPIGVNKIEKGEKGYVRQI